MNLEEICGKEYYIVDCENFTYFARKVHVIGVEFQGVDMDIGYTLDIPDAFNSDKYRRMDKTFVEQFKTFEEARNYAKELNNKPENKERKERWMSNAFSQSMLEMQDLLKEE